VSLVMGSNLGTGLSCYEIKPLFALTYWVDRMPRDKDRMC